MVWAVQSRLMMVCEYSWNYASVVLVRSSEDWCLDQSVKVQDVVFRPARRCSEAIPFDGALVDSFGRENDMAIGLIKIRGLSEVDYESMLFA